MKKHFLLLIMAFMSLTSWAADLRTVDALNPYYGSLPVLQVYSESATALGETYYTVDGYFKDAACTEANKLTEDEVKATDAGTTLYVKVSGNGGYAGTVTGSFVIRQRPLTIKGTPGTKVYGATSDGDIYTPGTAATSIMGGTVDLTTALTGKITFARAEGTNVGEYNITGTINDATYSKNYCVESASVMNAAGTAQAKYTITAKEFISANIDIADVAAVEYTGSEIKPEVVVTDKALKTTLKKDVDYTVAYSDNTSVGTATITVKGKGNYASNTINKNFTITGASVIINSTASKVYDGNNSIPTSGEGKLTYSYQGLPSGVTVTIDPSTYTPSTNAPAAGTVGTYKLTVDASKFFATNYSFIANEGVFTITAKEVEATAPTTSVAYGATENFTATLTSGTYVTGQDVAIKDAIKIQKAAEASADGSYVLTPVFKTEAEIDATVKAAAATIEAIDAGTGSATEKAAAKAAAHKAAQDAAKAVLKNYTLKAVNGKLTYTKANLKVALNESKFTLTKVYDGQDITIATPTSEDQLIIIGKKEGDVIDLSGLTVTIAAKTSTNKTKCNVDNYSITLSGLTSDIYNFTYISSTASITAKTLKVKANNQTFNVNTTATIDQSFYVIDPENGLASTDKASEVFKLAFSTAAESALTGGKFTAVNTYTNGIVVADCGTATSKYANYDVVATSGNVIVVDASASTTVTLDETKDLTTVLTSDVTSATVTFSAHDLKAEKWNVLVLPFEVTVKDLSDALGYAVIDVLNETASDGNIHFSLKVAGKIAANTPILVYPSGAINNLNSVTFTGVKVVKTTDNVSVADASGNKFVGTYKTTPIFGEKFRYMSAGTWFDAAKYTEASPANIKPLRGYLDLTGNAAAARALIYIDEPDGTTTAIKAISGDVISRNAEGWYTIGGMKLEGAPTQKGIYIQNGKKVVVK